MKRCSKCGVEKPLDEFQMNLGKCRADCKVCHKVMQQTSRARRDAGLIAVREVREKLCRKCGRMLLVESFALSGHGFRRASCKECDSAAARQRTTIHSPHAEYRPREDAEAGAITRKCFKCKTVKPISDFRPKRRSCRECDSDYNITYYAKHADEIRAGARQWYYDHREERARYSKEWYAAHRSEQLERMREYNLKRRITGQTYARLRRATPEGGARNRCYSRIRWDRLRKASEGQEPYTRAEIIERDNSTCYICKRQVAGRLLHLDHVIPLSKGGLNNRENVRVSCRECNSRKRARLPE